MSEISVSLRETAGDDVLLEFAVTDENDAAVNITGLTIRFAIARKAGATPVISTADSTATATITNGTGGIFQIAIDNADTQALRATYKFEAEIEDTLGGKDTVSKGYITFEEPVIS